MKKPVDEHAPKRAMSGYMLFSADNREKIRSNNPDAKVTEIMKKIGAEWNKLTDKGKKPYNDKSTKDKQAYEKKMEKYKKSANFKKHQEAMDEWKLQGTKKKFKKDPNRPKRGMSAYMLFVAEKRPGMTAKGVPMLEITKKCGALWGALSDGQKKKYNALAEKEKAKAEKEMAKYIKSKEYQSYEAEKEAYQAKQKAVKRRLEAGMEGKPKSGNAKKKVKKASRSVSKKRAGGKKKGKKGGK